MMSRCAKKKKDKQRREYWFSVSILTVFSLYQSSVAKARVATSDHFFNQLKVIKNTPQCCDLHLPRCHRLTNLNRAPLGY